LLAALFFCHAPAAILAQNQRGLRADAPRASARLSVRDERFLEDLSRRSFQFFWEQTDPKTGLTLDRAHADGSPYPDDGPAHNIASIASVGFGLTGICIAAERGWVTRDEARQRVRTTLDFFANRTENVHGWFYHFVDAATGERRWNSEVSSIDTALLLGGVLTARQYFASDAEIKRLADQIYNRVDFDWMRNGHPTLLSMGYKPESGFLDVRWDTFSEHLILQLLAIGSTTHPLKPEAWRAWRRDIYTYKGRTILTPHVSANGGNPLFVHQYPHGWVDFRGLRETWAPYTSYFENSVTATRVHRQFCMTDLARDFPKSYSANVWGITASDGEKGYTAWGGPPRDPAIDGTVVPCAAGGSLMFTPELSLAALRTMKEKFGEKIYKHYGFVDAFNPTTGWIDKDVIGIDVGMTLLSAENLRTGNVWRWFMRNPEITRALELAGLRSHKGRGRTGRGSAVRIRAGASPSSRPARLRRLNHSRHPASQVRKGGLPPPALLSSTSSFSY
jgi:hypothetical protein